MILTLLDTSAVSDNLGDQIIMSAIESVARELFPDSYVYRVATHEYMSRVSRRILAKSDLTLVCGTNLLSSNMIFRTQWKLNPWDAFSFRNTVLVGVGWRDYDRPPDAYAIWLLKRILSSGHTHSVRDAYTFDKLTVFGKKVANTSCPTLWRLTPEHCKTIDSKKSDAVVTTINWHRSNPEADKGMLQILKQSYNDVYFWPQASEDIPYFESLAVSGIRSVPPNLEVYDELLKAGNIDFIGCRLHGGIRAMQRGRRALIITVDNRAAEISRDTGLPTVQRTDLKAIESWIEAETPVSLALPTAAIERWKSQFR
jgi:polysaccharide pyruvyl transferase WcaK-like protein